MLVRKIFNYFEYDHSIHSIYLQKPDEKFKSKFKFCEKSISASVRVNSNLKTHLRHGHPEKLAEYENLLAPKTQIAKPPIDSPAVESLVSRQLFPSTKKYASNNPIQLKLERILVQLISKSNFSLFTIESTVLWTFVNTLNPQFRLCSRHKLKYNLIPLTYNRIKNQIISELSSAQNVNVTIDAWTDGSNK